MSWLAAPLTLVAGSRPVGQSPAKPALSRAVSDPPACGVAAGPDVELELGLAELAAAVELELELELEFDELPHAASARQAHTASKLTPRRRPLLRRGPRPARGRLRGLSPLAATISPPLSLTTCTG
jgi:hypothetical protein